MFRGWEERKEPLKRLLFPHGPTILRNNVQYLGPIQVVRLHIGWLVPLRLLGEGNCCAYKAKKEKRRKKHLKPKHRMVSHKHGPENWPVSGSVVAVVGEKIKVELPEDVKRDPPVGGRHIVVGLTEHGIKAVQGHVLGQQSVGQPIDLEQPLQLLKHGDRNVLARSACWVLQHLSLVCDPTTMEVRSSLSKRLMAWSRDLYMAAEILCVIRRFRSMERPSSCKAQEQHLSFTILE